MKSVASTLTLLLLLALAGCSQSSNSKPEAQDVADIGVDQTSLDVVPDAELDQQGDLDDDLWEGDADVQAAFPPRALPFEYTRPAKGEPIPDAEVEAFTRSVTGLWKDVDWFRWILRTSTGVDASSGQDDFLAWYNDIHAVKADGVVTLQQVGGDHNMWIPGSKVLTEAMNGCALTGDWTVCKVAEQYCKGLTASVKGFRWGDDDPAPFLMARAVFPNDNQCVMDEETWQDDGRTKIMEFHQTYVEEHGWNANKFAWPENPTWGSIWVTNMRSKDDVCAIVRTTTFLPYVIADAPYDWVRDACQETLDYMVGFNKDIVDHDYNIRTKDADGTPRLVTEEDLGSYTEYMGVGDDNECAARLATDLIAYQEPRTNDCGQGYPTVYDMVAPSIHYYNYPIVWDYHMAALGNALVYGYPVIAYSLLKGFTARMNNYLSDNSQEPGASDQDWNRDMALLLVKAAALGYPLNADEARLVQKHWLQAVEEFTPWPNWDLWDESIPDGEYGGGDIRPHGSSQGIQVEGVTMFLEYCNSPFKNPAGAKFIDCEIVADVSRWGE